MHGSNVRMVKKEAEKEAELVAEGSESGSVGSAGDVLLPDEPDDAAGAGFVPDDPEPEDGVLVGLEEVWGFEGDPVVDV